MSVPLKVDVWRTVQMSLLGIRAVSYSARSADWGSTRTARRVGTTQAIAVTTTSTMATVA
jgi:hypothetical protein